MTRTTLTNLDAGPRGLETAGGLVMIDAGAALTRTFAAGELAAATASGWFAISTADPAAPPKRRAR
jgi:hypothetical protein